MGNAALGLTALGAWFRGVGGIGSNAVEITLDDYAYDYQFMVAFFDSKGLYFCNGAMITTQHIVTAASCFLDVTGGQSVFINRNAQAGLGSKDLTAPTSATQLDRMQLHPIADVMTHSSWNPNNYRYHPALAVDLAVVRLQDHILMGKGFYSQAGNYDERHLAYPIPIISEDTANAVNRYEAVNDANGPRVVSYAVRTGGTQTNPTINYGKLNYITQEINEGKQCQWNVFQYDIFNLWPVSFFQPDYSVCVPAQPNSRNACRDWGDRGSPLVAPYQNFQTSSSTTRLPKFVLIGIFVGNLRYYANESGVPVEKFTDCINLNTLTQPSPGTNVLQGVSNYVSMLYWGPWIQQSTGVLLAPRVPAQFTTIGPTAAPTRIPIPLTDCSQWCGTYNPSRDCWCDWECFDHEDCCDSFYESNNGCPDIVLDVVQLGGPATTLTSSTRSDLYQGSCADYSYCGRKSADCWCDYQCTQTGDCCTDYYVTCGDNSPLQKWLHTGGSCLANCGGFVKYDMGPNHAITGCWCDPECYLEGDCCPNFQSQCGTKIKSCEGFCGYHNAGGNCWCDAVCQIKGDCCDDFGSICPAERLPSALTLVAVDQLRTSGR